MLGCVNKPNAMVGILQKCSPRYHGFKDTRFALDPQVSINGALLGNQLNQRLGLVSIELVGYKNPCSG